MTPFGEHAQSDLDTRLPDADIIWLRDTEVFPAVDYLAHRDFREQSRLGDVFSIAIRQAFPDGVIAAAMCAEVYIEHDEDPAQEYLQVDIEIKKQIDDGELLSDLITAATADPKNIPPGVDRAIRELEPMTAWEVIDHSFTGDDEIISERDTYFELQDDEGTTIWHNRQMTGGEHDALLGAQDEAEIDAFFLLENAMSALTKKGRGEVRFALNMLGFPRPLN